MFNGKPIGDRVERLARLRGALNFSPETCVPLVRRAGAKQGVHFLLPDDAIAEHAQRAWRQRVQLQIDRLLREG